LDCAHGCHFISPVRDTRCGTAYGVVFGGSAVIAVASVRPVALRCRFSSGLPLSNELFEGSDRSNKIAWLQVSQAKQTQKEYFVIFGGLAVVTAFAAIDP
jgi:hypothetical protein